jgi:aldehyde dehydrogenase (NAD+)
MPEAIGVVGVAAPDEAPLLGLISTIAPLIATGNAVVAIPSPPHPLAATDLYTVFESSDVPAGVINLVTGAKDALATVLAAHDDVESVWYWGTAAGRAAVETASAGNLKRTWCHAGPVDWTAAPDARAFLREATHVKNIWVPYGE